MGIIVYLIAAFALTEVAYAAQGWTAWSKCTVSCGGGNSIRFYRCDDDPSDDKCNSVDSGVECNVQPCPIDGGVGNWTAWSQCSKSCANGVRQRTRECDNPPPQHGGANCTEELDESEGCNPQPCPIDGGFGDWTAWGVCSVTCAGGNQTRTRECNNPTPQYGGANCVGLSEEIGNCNPQECPIDGAVGNWASWGACSISCGGGNRVRSRECNNPEPQFGGANCTESLDETGNCNTQPCPIDGGVGAWVDWSACSVTCGNGTKTRSRSCDNPEPQHGGANCTDELDDSADCFPVHCPIDGGVGAWGNWSVCTKTCGVGVKLRTRLCDSPEPQYNGSDCMDALTDQDTCSTNPCPVDGDVGEWSEWSNCTVTCGGGDRQRTRQCDSPAPAHGGANCVQELSETDNCSMHHCPIHGGVGAWGNWSDCSTTCGVGVLTRERLCDSPAPEYNGTDCTEELTETDACNHNVTCPPVDGGVGQWLAWGACSVTCGGGEKSRQRLCDNPAPEHNGADCTETLTQVQNCEPLDCVTVGGIGDSAAGLSSMTSLMTSLASSVVVLLVSVMVGGV